MATINGITIKSYKTFRGIEYLVCREANIWKGSKKIGTFTEDAWGGSANMTKGLSEAIKPSAMQYQSGCIGEYAKYESDTEVFISHILSLAEYEKVYKQNCKKGYMFTLFIGNGWKWIAYGFKSSFDYHDETKLHKSVKTAIKKEFPKGCTLWHGESESDFIITVDKNNPVPQYLYI